MAATHAEAGHYRIEIKRVRRALAQPLQTGGGHCIAVRESVLLKVTAKSDPTRTGYGEAAPLPWFGTESADAAANALAALGDTLEQCQADKIASLLATYPCAQWALQSALRQAGALPQLAALHNASATQQSAVATQSTVATQRSAFTDKAGSTAAAPQSTVFVPHIEPPAVATIPVAALLPAGTSALPQGLLAAGFRVFKTKIGVCPFDEEAATVTALLRSLQQYAVAGSDTAASRTDALCDAQTAADKITENAAPFKLRLDANGGLSASSLCAWLQLLAPFADFIDFIEQPLPIGQEAQTAAAFAGSPLAFAFDESLTSLPQLLQISKKFPQAVLVVKPSLLGSAGGFLQWRNSGCDDDSAELHANSVNTKPCADRVSGASDGDAPNATSRADKINTALRDSSSNADLRSDSVSADPADPGTDSSGAAHARSGTNHLQSTLPTGTPASPVWQRRIIYSSALETGIGLHHALCLAAADPLPPEPVGFGTGGLFAQDGLGAPPQHTPWLPRPAACDTPAVRAQMEAIWKQV